MLITGVTSGFGKFMTRAITYAKVLTRDDMAKHRTEIDELAEEEFSKEFHDVIIHCAHDRLDEDENLRITSHLLRIPHSLFIYISSVDVYRQWCHDLIPTKLKCEEMIKARSCNYLIYRCGAMLGLDARPNSFIKMLDGKPLNVTADSTFGYITHNRLANTILHDKDCRKNETLHALGEPLSMEFLAERFKCKPQYGSYKYTTPNIWHNRRIESMFEIESYMRDRISAGYDVNGQPLMEVSI